MKHPTLRPATVELVRRWFVPALLVLVVSHQLYRVHVDGLSPRRGGGFGLAGGYHPAHNDLWWIDTETGAAFRYAEGKGVGTQDGRRPEVRPFLTRVNEKDLRTHHRALPEPIRNRTEIEVLQLDFDPKSGELGRRVLISTEEGGEK